VSLSIALLGFLVYHVEHDRYRIDTPFRVIPVGTNLILECLSSGKTKWFFKHWKKKSKVRVLNMRRKILVLNRVTFNQSGQYYCYGVNILGDKFISSVHRIIYGMCACVILIIITIKLV